VKIVAFIFARGGSKGVKRKNIRPLKGKPLIAYSIEGAKQSSLIDDVYVSTEDDEIAKISSSYGAKVIERPRELAGDNSPEWLSWQHAINSVEDFDIFISLPATSPFRNLQDIERSIQKLKNEPSADAIISITQASRNPWFNMVRLDQEGCAELVNSSGAAPPTARRQDAPLIYDMTTISFTTTPSFIKNNRCLFDGKVKTIEIPQERSLDIDTEFDFLTAEALQRC
jgi:N,N'-diacetyl-8-epilegionaminate cytidylyltransferase